MQPLPQCLTCKHLDRDALPDVMRCKAFKRIPDAIFADEADHRKPFSGDGGVRWEADTDEDGDPIPHPQDYVGLQAVDEDVMP